MSSFFTSGFARKKPAARGKDSSVTAQHSSGKKGDRSPSSVSENLDYVGAEMAAGDSWIMLQDREDCRYSFNSRTGDWVYHTPIAPSFNYLVTTPPAPSVQPPTNFGYPHPSYVTTPPAPSVQPLTTFGYPHPTYVTTPGLYPAAPQRWVVSPSPTSRVVEPLVLAPSREKNTGKYYVWKKFTDEDGRAVWIHTISGKRTLVDPYK